MSKPTPAVGTLEECTAKLAAFAAENGVAIIAAGAQTTTERRAQLYLYTEQADVYVDVLLAQDESGQVSASLIASEPAVSAHKEFGKRILSALS